MKPIANGIILKSRTVSAVECLRYALTLPTSVVITGIDSMKVLDQACDVATTFEPFGERELFDGTADRPEWLGDESKRAQRMMKREPGYVHA